MRRATGLVGVLAAALVFTCTRVVAADYPNNVPDLKIADIRGDLSFLIQLEPNESVQVTGSFAGSDTGCAVYIHNVGTGEQVLKMPHVLGKNPESFTKELKNTTNKRASYVVSVWTFIGGPPHVPLPEGWDQVGPDKGTFQVVPGQAVYVIQGSTHGPTTLKFSVTQS
ncbi:MAG: hypothetical protein WCA49_18625 [Candidatus Sulfotelmatobacter sp.]